MKMKVTSNDDDADNDDDDEGANRTLLLACLLRYFKQKLRFSIFKSYVVLSSSSLQEQ